MSRFVCSKNTRSYIYLRPISVGLKTPSGCALINGAAAALKLIWQPQFVSNLFSALAFQRRGAAGGETIIIKLPNNLVLHFGVATHQYTHTQVDEVLAEHEDKAKDKRKDITMLASVFVVITGMIGISWWVAAKRAECRECWIDQRTVGIWLMFQQWT